MIGAGGLESPFFNEFGGRIACVKRSLNKGHALTNVPKAKTGWPHLKVPAAFFVTALQGGADWRQARLVV